VWTGHGARFADLLRAVISLMGGQPIGELMRGVANHETVEVEVTFPIFPLRGGRADDDALPSFICMNTPGCQGSLLRLGRGPSLSNLRAGINYFMNHFIFFYFCWISHNACFLLPCSSSQPLLILDLPHLTSHELMKLILKSSSLRV
jgi:hypothetical protein